VALANVSLCLGVIISRNHTFRRKYILYTCHNFKITSWCIWFSSIIIHCWIPFNCCPSSEVDVLLSLVQMRCSNFWVPSYMKKPLRQHPLFSQSHEITVQIWSNLKLQMASEVGNLSPTCQTQKSREMNGSNDYLMIFIPLYNKVNIMQVFLK